MGEKQVKFDISDVTNKFLLHLKKITDNVTLIYSAVDEYDANFSKPLPTDSFPIGVYDGQPRLPIVDQKEAATEWILTKAFEELVYGLIKSFKETYRYLSYYDLSQKQDKTMTKGGIEKELERIEKELEEFHFPTFIQKIELLLNRQLPLKEEILSINQIRKCLIHRFGRVGDIDVKYSKNNDLRLKWISLRFWTTINNIKTEVTYDLRKDRITVNELSSELIKNEKIFELGEEISIDINEFNGIAYTCAKFVEQVLNSIPIPIEKK